MGMERCQRRKKREKEEEKCLRGMAMDCWAERCCCCCLYSNGTWFTSVSVYERFTLYIFICDRLQTVFLHQAYIRCGDANDSVHSTEHEIHENNNNNTAAAAAVTVVTQTHYSAIVPTSYVCSLYYTLNFSRFFFVCNWRIQHSCVVLESIEHSIV